MVMQLLNQQIANFELSALNEFSKSAPWQLTSGSTAIVERLLKGLVSGFDVRGNIAVHQTATIETGAIIKGPAIIGPNCFIASGAYVRGGCWLEDTCVLGPGSEMKSSFFFKGTKLAHFNFVGDSILGSNVNLEAGSLIANFRNERPDSTVSFMYGGKRIETGAAKFGALIGDHTKIGANAVIAPGAILAPGTIVERLSLIDHGPTRSN
jgi:UDP-N-acetylglucosamine diphosphorylase / glucose-1-phosphate thymidylyltransferase / UDP-N-acetylgalactosamine diphosphorylase / glucosamine-1-phosphate N-acetyltransferase / galactosamine-1-phosphate N-acetyltransferase